MQVDNNFPSAKYFQIHFQYLHEIIGDLSDRIDLANRQIAELQEQIGIRSPINISQGKAGIDQDAA